MAKIVIVNDLVLGGGVENVMYNLVQYLEKRNYDITIVTLFGNVEDFKEQYSSKIKKVSLKKYFKPYKRGSIQWFLSRIARVLISFTYKIKRYDIVIAMKEGDAAKFASGFNANKKIAWVHADYSSIYWTQYVFKTAERELKCMSSYDKVICVSEAAKKGFIDTIGDSGNLVVKYNPINADEIIKKASCNNHALVKNKDAHEDSVIFVAVGRLAEVKRYDNLLEICLKLSRKGYDFELWLVGDGEERETLEAFISANKMTNVMLWGNQDNPYPFIKNADWFISTSRTESYGLAIQESLIVGTPVIAMKCPAIEECVSREYAILVDNNFDELYKAMEEVLSSPQENKRYKQNLEGMSCVDVYQKRLEEIEQLWM